MRFPALTPRVGLLGQVTFLASTAGPAETSPTARGIFVREHLLCQNVPSPPPGVNTNLPEPDIDKPLTMRERMQMHVENPACAACHRLMDPIGFGLENFDGIGRWREKETIEFRVPGSRQPGKRFELAIDARGEVAGLAPPAFGQPRLLGRMLAESAVCQECIVRQYFRYAFGRLETAADQETIRAATAAFRGSGFKFQELVAALVRSPQFLAGSATMETTRSSRP